MNIKRFELIENEINNCCSEFHIIDNKTKEKYPDLPYLTCLSLVELLNKQEDEINRLKIENIIKNSDETSTTEKYKTIVTTN